MNIRIMTMNKLMDINNSHSDSNMSPLEVNSFNSRYINVRNNKSGIVISIPENQPEIEIGDEWEIHYSVLSNCKNQGGSTLIEKGIITGTSDGYIPPTIKTPSFLFPEIADRTVNLWYVIKKKDNENLTSSFNKQILATKV